MVTQAKLLGGKYLTARGTRVADVYHVAGAADGDLYLTEGATKANVAEHAGGLWVFAVPGQSLTPQHVEAIKGLQPERVIVALDREDNANTDRACERCLRMLWEADLPVYVWEGEDVGGPKGPAAAAHAAGRAFAALDGLQTLHTDGRVVACSHGHVIPVLVAFLIAARGLPGVPQLRHRGQWYRVRLVDDDVGIELREADGFPR